MRQDHKSVNQMNHKSVNQMKRHHKSVNQMNQDHNSAAVQLRTKTTCCSSTKNTDRNLQ